MDPKGAVKPPPAENRQAERRRVAERRLLESAAEIISESGPSSLTLAEVGVRAGYSRGLATHYFGSKSAMVEKLLDAVGEQFTTQVEPPAAGFVSDQLLRPIVDWYFGILSDFKPMNKARILLWADAATHGESELRGHALAMDKRFRARVEKWIVHLQSEGACDVDVNAEAFAVTFVGMMRGIALQMLVDPTIDLDQVKAEVHRTSDMRLSGRLTRLVDSDD